jgi:hypothetical protein
MTVKGYQTPVPSTCHHHLTYVYVAFAVNPDVVRSKEVAWRSWITTAAPPRLQTTVQVKDAQPASRCLWRGDEPRKKPRVPSDFRHKDILLAINEHFHGTRHISPLRNEFPRQIENLDTAIFTVCNISSAFAIDREAVRQIELARLRAGRSPRV